MTSIYTVRGTTTCKRAACVRIQESEIRIHLKLSHTERETLQLHYKMGSPTQQLDLFPTDRQCICMIQQFYQDPFQRLANLISMCLPLSQASDGHLASCRGHSGLLLSRFSSNLQCSNRTMRTLHLCIAAIGQCVQWQHALE